MPPPKLRLISADKQVIETNTLPEVGSKFPNESLPVVLAKGVNPTQYFVEVPAFDPTKDDTIESSIVIVLENNIDRRYLKIRNNGDYPVELWCNYKPKVNQIGQSVPRGEVLEPGAVIFETDTCRTCVIYATCAEDTVGLSVLEG